LRDRQHLRGYGVVQGIERVDDKLADDPLANVRFEIHGATSGDRIAVLGSRRNVTVT
jgi:hypothetical protein